LCHRNFHIANDIIDLLLIGAATMFPPHLFHPLPACMGLTPKRRSVQLVLMVKVRRYSRGVAKR
jgi:hypothetical protein